MVGAQLRVENSRSITLVPSKISCYILIERSHVHPVDRKACDARIVRDNLVLRDQMPAFDAPAYSARDARDLVHHSRLVVHRSFLWVHLISQEARECWLVDTCFRVLESRIQRLTQAFLGIRIDQFGLASLMLSALVVKRGREHLVLSGVRARRMTPWRLVRDDRRIWLLNDRFCALVHFSRCYEFIPTDIDLAEAKLLRVIGQFLRQRVFKNGSLAHLS